MNRKLAQNALEAIASRRLPDSVIVSFARKVLAGATVAQARRAALAEEDTEPCEGCETRVPIAEVERDADGVPLCKACMRSLLSEPPITADLLAEGAAA